MKQPRNGDRQPRTNFNRRVKERTSRKLKARREGDRTIWYGLGMFGIVGWSVAIPTIGEGLALANALRALAQQPDQSNTITRTLFVGLALVESTAIYCFVVSMILIFANPFWDYFIQNGG